MKPEDQARIEIDRQLEQCGWVVQDHAQMNISAGSGVDALASDPGDRFSFVLTNPPFGKKSSIAVVNEEGQVEKEAHAYERQDFWTTTKNKQLNFLQHVKTLLKVGDRCACPPASSTPRA